MLVLIRLVNFHAINGVKLSVSSPSERLYLNIQLENEARSG
jgi:hypothetical protein